MNSFRTELENPVVERDIIELERKIRLFREGKVDEARFRSLRLARGVYGQRQPGVQMVRIKLPYGRMTVRQLRRICAVADEYSTGNLHLTTRQDIQIHYVSLDRTPELWAELEKDEVTLREACGNTVRNVTASPLAGVDPAEPFDVTPYAEAFFRYFLRNPVCQEMGRKFKVSFSSSDADTAFAFMHDLGFIPRLQEDENGKQQRGFKVLVGGGLGGQPKLAEVAHEFLPADQIIPFSEAVLRIFDRFGERNKRFRARMKFLLKQVGLEELLRLVAEEKTALPQAAVPIDPMTEGADLPAARAVPAVEPGDRAAYARWHDTNVFAQKQPGYYAIGLRILLGDLSTEKARLLADLVEKWAGDDLRVTQNQGLLLRHVPKAHLPYLYEQLAALDLAEAGFDSLQDITACPGTDTCNLGISSSTGISRVLEKVLAEEYPDTIAERQLKIKISGCMNACGQHTLAGIGFHGSTLKAGDRVVPALQVLLGGGVLGNGDAVLAEKVIKLPSKRGPDSLRWVLDDFEAQALEGEYFHQYYQRQGKKYFYALLKPLAAIETLQAADYRDWGHEETFIPEIGVGECAGVVIDLVATLIFETQEKVQLAHEALDEQAYADSIYHSYSAFVNGAKAWLVAQEANTNTQAGIIRDFGARVAGGEFGFAGDFPAIVYQMKEQQPTADFAQTYLNQAADFVQRVAATRPETL